MAEEVRPVWTADSPLAGEQACEELRAHGIKCDCVEAPAEDARMSPTAYSGLGNQGTEWVVVVGVPDAERAEQVLKHWRPRG
jgi:hypothetical protein